MPLHVPHRRLGDYRPRTVPGRIVALVVILIFVTILTTLRYDAYVAISVVASAVTIATGCTARRCPA